ncbi:helix-turn-helix domain-containing protein [Pseudomonas putida]|uniref:Helix-turn-helix domain-containing protein n=1 Tax=Pseudomonas putida TaxID=303 RepID=A0A2Z4RT64_PSEPU|nr:AraC family transcriptional regulator [Pseudomonas putida]AWY44249.1 helix-turn-helix domain-containing protein [Pseudomonas putida]
MTMPRASAQWFQGMLPALAQRGVDVEHLLARSGIDPQVLNDSEASIAHIQIAHFWTQACELTGDPLLALRASQDFRPGCMSQVGHLMLAAPTLADALTHLMRYQQLLSDVSDCDFSPQADGATLRLDVTPQVYAIPQAITDMTMGATMVFCRWLLGAGFRPKQVCLRRPPPSPADLALYRSVFDCPIRFDSPNNCMQLSSRDLQTPLPLANPQVFEVHREHLEERLKQRRQQSIALQVGNVLQQLLPEGEPSRERVAGLLNLSPSTLHRRLLAEGTTYKTLLDQRRAVLARGYVIQGTRPLLDIAFQLGFSDPSNFFRSFKRWYGVSPGRYRKQADKPAALASGL